MFDAFVGLVDQEGFVGIGPAAKRFGRLAIALETDAYQDFIDVAILASFFKNDLQIADGRCFFVGFHWIRKFQGCKFARNG